MQNEQENIKLIHQASMKILETTGMKFLHPDALKILQDNGVEITDGNIAHFTEKQVMEWIGKAPQAADLHAADPQYDVSIGGDRSYNAPAATTVQIKEKDGIVRQATLDDCVNIFKLYEANPSYMINGGLPIQADGIPTEWSTLLMHYLSLLSSNKSLWSCTGNYEQMEAVIDLTCARFDITREELKQKPRIMAICNTLTPLEFDINMTESLLTFGKYHQPITIAAAGMAGTTSPITLAGTIATVNAEILGTAVLAQMNAPGTPIIYGSATTTADLRSCAIAIGAPESAISAKYGAALAKFYGLPCRGGGTLTDAKKLDAQAGYEGMLVYSTARRSKMNLIYHSAGVLNSYLYFSFEKLISDFEIIDYVDRFLRDIEVNDETVPLDLIDEVGASGSYLLEDHTLEYCRTEPLTPNISVRGAVDDGENEDEAFEHNIQKRMDALLDSYQKPEVDEVVIEKMRAVLRTCGIDDALIAALDAAL